LAVAIMIAVAAVAWHGRAPWLFAREEKARAAEMRGELQAVEAETRELREKEKRWASPQGPEEEARRQGWVEPGEEIVNVPKGGE
jgi:hypothetical protein